MTVMSGVTGCERANNVWIFIRSCSRQKTAVEIHEGGGPTGMGLRRKQALGQNSGPSSPRKVSTHGRQRPRCPSPHLTRSPRTAGMTNIIGNMSHLYTHVLSEEDKGRPQGDTAGTTTSTEKIEGATRAAPSK